MSAAFGYGAMADQALVVGVLRRGVSATVVTDVATVPEELRPAIGEQLDALVEGQLPGLMTWVRQYGRTGAILVPQPPEIWTHSRTDLIPVATGGWTVVLPLWTTEEAPSDLTAEGFAAADGRVTIHEVHVL
jgi:hypothetical protein